MAAISFARGAPAPECLDQALIADCARAALERDGDDDPLLRHRRRLRPAARGARGAARRRARAGSSSRPAACRGSSSTRPFSSRSGPGRVLVEGPTYDRPLKILARDGAEVVPLAMDDEGLDLDALEAELQRGRRRSRSSTRSRPSRTRPAARSGRSAGDGSSSSRPQYDLPDSRGRPVRARPLRRRAGSVDPRARGRRAGHVHLVVLEDRGTRPAHRLLRRPGGARRGLRRSRGLDLHLAEPAAAGDRVRAHRSWCLRAEPRPRARPAQGAQGRDARGPRSRDAGRHELELAARAATSSGSTSRATSTRRSC